MIKLRTHIISLTAVFLALGIGLVLGSTFLDRTFVDALDAQVKRLNDRVEQRNAEVDSLTKVLDEQTLTEAAASEAGYEQLLAGQLADSEVVLLANRGIDEDQVDRTVEVLQAADAEVPAVLWLTDRWNPTDADRSADIAEALELEATQTPEEVTAQAAAMLASALAGPSPSATSKATTTTATPTTTSVPDGDAAPATSTSAAPPTSVEPEADPEEVLARLADAKLIEQQAAPSKNLAAPEPEALIVSISGEGSSLDPTVAYLPIVAELVASNPGRVLLAETRNTRTLQQEATDEDVPPRGASLEAIRTDDDLRGQSSTLDGLESPLGKAAVVVALMEMSDGKTGDYGMAAGTDGPLPSITR